MSMQQILESGGAPILAILRGVQPTEAASLGATLVDAGIRLIEVPLNSLDALSSIEILARALGKDAVLGAGTVTTEESVASVCAAGGSIVVMPHTDEALIRTALALGMTPVPGFATPTEAFKAIAAGARHLKLFPATALGTGYFRSIREVLPPAAGVWAVGGTDAGNIRDWFAAGAIGAGVGSGLFRPGDSAETVAQRASALVQAWRRVRDS